MLKTTFRILTIFVVWTILTTEICHGQVKKFDFGLEGGPSLKSLYGNSVLKKNHKWGIGFSGGLFFQLNFKRNISLRTNIVYERKGSIDPYQRTDSSGNPLGKLITNGNYDYLTLPILIRATFGHKVKYFVNAGPYFGYLIKAGWEQKGDNFTTRKGDLTAYTKRFDSGISAGLGLTIPIKSRFYISFEIRNNLGLYNISPAVYNDNCIKTNSTNLLFGLTYKLRQ